MIEGGSVSTTVTVKLHRLLLPAASVAVYVIAAVPAANNDPLAGPPVCTIDATPQLSAAVGAIQLTIAPHSPGCVGTGPMFSGHPLITGGVSSITVTLKLHMAVLPA